jgi:hypothetical protein
MKANGVLLFERQVLFLLFKYYFTGLAGIKILKKIVDINLKRFYNIKKNGQRRNGAVISTWLSIPLFAQAASANSCSAIFFSFRISFNLYRQSKIYLRGLIKTIK